MKKQFLFYFLAMLGLVNYNPQTSAAEVTPALPPKPVQSLTPAATLETGSAYYLYNEGANGFLTSRKITKYDSEGVVATLPDAYAALAFTHEPSDDTWRIKTPRYTGTTQYMFHNTDGIYMDSGAADGTGDVSKWTLTSPSSGKFRIAAFTKKSANEAAADNAKQYAAPNGKSPARIYADKTEQTAGSYLDWVFYDAASFDPALYEAKAKLHEWLSVAYDVLSGQSTEDLQTAYDSAVGVYGAGSATEVSNAATSLQRAVSVHMVATGKYIYNPSFDTGILGWTSTVEYGYSYAAVEIYRRGISDFSQTIAGLPKGLYKLTAQAFYRNDGGSNAYMYAGSVQKQLNLRTGSENNMQQATNSFAAGLYPMEIVFSQYEAGDLAIGIKNTDALNTWIIFDLFNLEKLSDDPVVASQELIDELTALIAEAEILCAGNAERMGEINEEKEKANGYTAFVTSASEVESSIGVIKAIMAVSRENYITNTRLAGTFTEVWNGSHAANADERETIILSAGTYTLMGNAFQRRYQQGNTQAGVNRYKEGTEEIAAYLYMTPAGGNTVTQPIRSIYSKPGTLSGAGTGLGYADGGTAATTEFENGYYLNVLNFELTETTEVTVGLRITSGNWNCFGNFRLFRSDAMALSFSDEEQFIAPVLGATMKELKYVRNFPDTKVNPTTSNGWQSLCLPFDVTSIKLGETELIPGTNCWLFEAQGGNYVPVTEIEANKYYLMSLPNDPAYYVEDLCLYGNVTFTGTDLAAKAAFPEVAVSGEYTVTASYEGAYTNAVMGGNSYGILDVAETTYFVKGQYNGTFWAHAKATAGEGAFESFNIFGDLTSIRPITGDRSGSKDVTVAGVEGGIELNAATSQFVRIYSFGGQLVKAMQVPSGTIRIELPAGEYIVSGQKVIVTF